MTSTNLTAGRALAPGVSRPLRVRLSDLIPVFIFAICFTAWIPASVTVAGLNLRLSPALLPLVLGLLLMHQSIRRVSRPALLLLLAASLYWASLVFWTLSVGPVANGIKPLGRVALMGLNMLHMVVIYLLIMRTGRLRAALTAFVASVALLNLVLALAVAALAFHLPLPQGWVSSQDAPLLADGILTGGLVDRFGFGGLNAGCVSAAALVLALSMMLDRSWDRPKWFVGAIGLVSFGLVLGFSRQAVLSLAAGLLVIGFYLVVRGYLGRLLRVVVGMLAIGAVAILGLSVAPGGQPYVQAFAGRTAQLVQPDAYTSGTAADRASLWSGMWQDILANPLAGRGQDAYLVHFPGSGEGAHDFPLEVWHATGLSGLAGYLVLHLFILWAAGRALLARGVSVSMRWRVLGLFSAYIAVVLASITNIIYWNPTYWLVLGLLLAAVRLAYTASERHALTL